MVSTHLPPSSLLLFKYRSASSATDIAISQSPFHVLRLHFPPTASPFIYPSSPFQSYQRKPTRFQFPPQILHHQKLTVRPPLPQASTNYKEAFALFDKRGNGRVTLQSLGDLLRACGQNPTLAEISDLEKSVGGDCECFPPCWIRIRSDQIIFACCGLLPREK